MAVFLEFVYKRKHENYSNECRDDKLDEDYYKLRDLLPSSVFHYDVELVHPKYPWNECKLYDEAG